MKDVWLPIVTLLSIIKLDTVTMSLTFRSETYFKLVLEGRMLGQWFANMWSCNRPPYSRGWQGFLQMSASLHYMRYYSSSLIQTFLLLLTFSATFPSKCCFTETEVEQEVQEMHLTCFRMQQDTKLSLLYLYWKKTKRIGVGFHSEITYTFHK